MSGRVHAEAKATPKSSYVPVRTGLLVGYRGKQLVSQPPLVQAKLTINQPNDRYEQEADRIAEQVLRMPELRLQPQVEPDGKEEEMLQTKPLSAQITPLIQRQIEPEEEEEEELIQAKETSGQTPHVSPIVQTQIHSLRGGGQRLSPSLRNFFEPRFGHDFSKVRVHSTGKGMIQTKLKINKPGNLYEQDAVRVGVAAEVLPFSSLGLLPLAIYYVYIRQRQLHAKQMYDKFIRNAESYGLPVSFLQRVGRDYYINFGSSKANIFLNTMTLEKTDLCSASQMAPALPIEPTAAIQTIYHEATHAYLDLVSEEPRFNTFIAEGEKHYHSAPTTEGTITTDSDRVFQEAAASYVGDRASNWWHTFKMLSIYTSMVISDPDVAGRLKKYNTFARLRDDYNQRMAKVVYGYSEEGGFLRIGSKQVNTTRAMTDEMKTFLDHELLEDKIPDRFEAVAGFQKLLNRTEVTLSSPVAEPGPTPAIVPSVQR